MKTKVDWANRLWLFYAKQMGYCNSAKYAPFVRAFLNKTYIDMGKCHKMYFGNISMRPGFDRFTYHGDNKCDWEEWKRIQVLAEVIRVDYELVEKQLPDGDQNFEYITPPTI